MTRDDSEELLGQSGRRMEPPARLRRAVLRVPNGWVLSRQVRAWRIQIAAAAAAVLLVATGAVAAQQLTAFHSVAAVTLRGAPGTQAVAELGQPEGPNRPVRLVVKHLKPGAVPYYELWSLTEQPPMMLTTFMTDTTGARTVTPSI